MGSLLLEKLTEEFPDKIAFNFSVYPGSSSDNGNSDVIVEPYNTIFSLNTLIESSHASFTIENNSLYRICDQNLKIKNPSFADVNQIVALAMSNATASLRFPGISNNSDIRKLCNNLVPFPRLHFLT
jgi:tubulin beta